jgi:glycolate oxidase FAD binding subunit
MMSDERILPITETVAPRCEAEVVEVLLDANRNGTALYPTGGGTWIDYGASATRQGIELSCKGFDRLVDYPVDDMTITVETGMTVARLNEHLAAAGQRLPIDVPNNGGATIGGLVATGFSGPRRYAHGTIRDYLIGIRAVDGRGIPFAAGGRVVKNAAGYDMCRLMVGSLGTLAITTQVTLKVRPRPEATAMVIRDLPDLETAERLLAGLVHSKTRPVAVEMLIGPAWEEHPAIGPALHTSVARLLVGFEGQRSEVDWMVEQLLVEWRDSDAANLTTIADEEAGPLWDWMTEFPAQLRIATRPSATVAMVSKLLAWETDCSIQVHAGDGIIKVCHWPLLPDKATEVLGETLRPMVETHGGRMTVLCCPGNVKLTPEDVWGTPDGESARKAMSVSRAIKDRFDPANLLNPDRYIY